MKVSPACAENGMCTLLRGIAVAVQTGSLLSNKLNFLQEGTGARGFSQLNCMKTHNPFSSYLNC